MSKRKEKARAGRPVVAGSRPGRTEEPDQSGNATDAEAPEEVLAKSTTPTETGSSPEETEVNPPRTTTGKWFTAPKFGSAGSGGAELEPGPERD